MESSEKLVVAVDAHSAPEVGVLTIANVRTSRKKPVKGARVNGRVDEALYTEAAAKAKRQGTTINAIIEAALKDFVGGSFMQRSRSAVGRKTHAMLGAEFRRMLVEQRDLLYDLTNIAASDIKSPLAEVTCKKLLAELVLLNGGTFKQISRNRRHAR